MSPYLQLGEPVGLVAGVLRVDEFGKQEFAELRSLLEHAGAR